MNAFQCMLRVRESRALLLSLGVASVLLAKPAHASDYYVGPTGSDSNPGTLDQPFANLQKGVDVAVAGDTVYIRGGTYKITSGASDMSGVAFSKSGQSDTKRIRYWAYQDEHPVFDFTSLRLSSTKTCAGFYVTGSWLHFKGIEIHDVPEPGTVANNGVWTVGGSNNIYELLNLHHNHGPGLSIANGNGGHLILNTDSHDNYDANSAQGAGQNADGFGCHYQKSGTSTTFRGCRSWWNSDDGYDLISQEYPVIIENSWAMGNGYINSGSGRPAAGNGNGFKAGSSKTGVRHVIQNCVAWKNTAAGFYANHSSGGNDWYNDTSYNNSVQFNMLASSPTDSGTTIILSGDKVHRMRNNIGFPDKNTNMNGVDTKNNTWDLMITPSMSDFVSVSDAGYMGPRQVDGSLPALDFMKLTASSAMIDKGVDVGLSFGGAHPDLGAYEYGTTTSTANGGAGGVGTGNAGAATSGGSDGVAGGPDGTAGSVAASGGSDSVGNAGSGTASAGAPSTGFAGSASVAGSSSTPSGTAGGSAAPEAGDTGAGASCAFRSPAGHAASTSFLAGLSALGLVLARRRRHAR